MRRTAILGASIWMLAPCFAMAEVIDSAAGGFTVKTVLTIQAPPDEVYRRLVHDVGKWWDPKHTFSGHSSNLRIDDQAMGCFCEKLPDGGGVRHMEVVFAAPGKSLVLAGALGPLQQIAATGHMAFAFAAAPGGGTNFSVSYSVSGYLAKGMNTWAEPVDAVLKEQVTRLKNLIEKGSPSQK